jgi:hypothetical protein
MNFKLIYDSILDLINLNLFWNYNKIIKLKDNGLKYQTR